jgi:carboxymethylenebutenolidase
VAENITFNRKDGKTCQGYYAEPAGGGAGAPGIVVLQEWWGVNDQIRGVADRLTEAGYRTLVPDLYRGKVTLEAAEASHMMTNLDFADAAGNDIAGAVQHLKQGGARVGVIGFCMGGALTVLSSMFTEADAASSWYGIPPEAALNVNAVHMPLQCHYALQDGFFTPAMFEAWEKQLKAAGKPSEFYAYDADHAFGNETGAAYNAAAAEQAWSRSLELFARHLR